MVKKGDQFSVYGRRRLTLKAQMLLDTAEGHGVLEVHGIVKNR